MIKYIGKKHLNSNFYKSISLVEEENDVKVKAIVDERFKNVLTMKTDTKVITEQIDSLPDYEKVKEIVLYFLRNNTICELIQEKDKIIVNSISSRKLVLQLSSEYKELLKIILDKYQNDRLGFINSCNAIEFYITGLTLKITEYTSSYYLNNDNLELCLMYNGKIAPFDIKFLKDYLKDLIDNCIDTIKTETIDGLRYNIYIGDKKISLVKFFIPQEVLKDIYSWILNRNYEIYEMNNKQLKLEGIK